MNPQLARDFIEKLKADRRAELARTTAESAARADADRQQAEQAFNADLSAALAQLDAAWLLGFRADDGKNRTWEDDDGMEWRRTRFNVSGHRPIELILTYSMDGWILPADESLHWFAETCADGRGAGVHTLADALIAAECGPEDREPIPF